MFIKLLNWIRKQVGKIIPTQTIEERMELKIDISDTMVRNIELWGRMYKNEAPWLEQGKIESLNIPSAVASEMARLVTIEMESEITSGQEKENERSEYLNEQYQQVIDSLRIETEYAMAKGGMILKPYLDKNNDIAIEYVQADEFYPVEFNSGGELIAAIFPEVITKGDTTYTRLEYHHMIEGNRCYISNEAYVKDINTEGLGLKVGLKTIEEWAELEPEVNLEGISEPLFSYFRTPLANNKDTKSKLGVSVYSKSVDLIKEVDKHYSGILWEFQAKEAAIDVPMDMFDSTGLPKGKERLFRQLDIDDGTKGKNFYEVFSPAYRDESLFNGLNKLLRQVEFNCGLAYGTLSDMDEAAKTATEIKASRQRSYATVVDIQKSLRISLEHLIRSMDYLTTLYELAPAAEFEVSFTFDDSIVVDSEAEQAIMLSEVSAGLIKPEYYLMKRYGVSEEEAKNMLPSMDPGIQPSQFDSWE